MLELMRGVFLGVESLTGLLRTESFYVERSELEDGNLGEADGDYNSGFDDYDGSRRRNPSISADDLALLARCVDPVTNTLVIPFPPNLTHLNLQLEDDAYAC
jgi:hypothetical protein